MSLENYFVVFVLLAFIGYLLDGYIYCMNSAYNMYEQNDLCSLNTVLKI